MKAAAARGKHLGRPPLSPRLVDEIKALAASTDLSIRKIHEKIGQKASRGRVGEITKRVRSGLKNSLRPVFTRILNLPLKWLSAIAR